MVNFTELLSRSDENETDGDPPETDGGSELEALDPGDAEPSAIEPPDADTDDTASDGPSTTELQARVTDLEDDLEATSDDLRRLTTAQEELGDTVEDMNDTLRELAGMYDEAMAARNPFVDAPETDPQTTAGPDPMTDSADQTSSQEDDAVVSFEDLVDEDRSESDDPSASAPGTTAHSEHSTSANSTSRTSTADGARPEPSADSAVTLETVPEGYAAEVLLLEWLSTLTAVGGPAGALQAIDHYEEVGWISPAVRRHLIDLLGGPSLDVFVDPTQPDEPTARQHAQSYNYLRVLDGLQDL